MKIVITNHRAKLGYSVWGLVLFSSVACLPQATFAGVAKCFGVTDTSPGKVFYAVPSPGASSLPSGVSFDLTGARTSFNGEGAAFRASDQKLYAFECGGDTAGPCDLYSITPNFNTHVASTQLVKSNIVPSGSRAVEGAIFEVRPDGTEFLYAVVGESDGRLYKWDPNNNWSLQSGYPKSISGDSNHLTGLAYDPIGNQFYGSLDYPGALGGSSNSDILRFDLATARTTFVGEVSRRFDAEGISFAADGNLYMEDEGYGSSSDFADGRILRVNLNSTPFAITEAANLEGINPGGVADFESIACNTGERSDFGDAPLSYGIAVHSVPIFDADANAQNAKAYLGSLPADNDNDPRAQAGNGADGDNNTASAPNAAGTSDEDGVSLNGSLLQNQSLSAGGSYTLKVATNGRNSGYLNAWVDLNADGDFSDSGEQVATNVAGSAGGSIDVPVSIPAGTSPGTTYARFRYSTQQNLGASDNYLDGVEAADGEVEDYRLQIIQGTDLKIVKTASAEPVASGDSLTYTLTVTNSGSATASNVVVRDVLPAAVTHVNTTPSQGSCSDPDGVICELGDLSSGASATVNIGVTVN